MKLNKKVTLGASALVVGATLIGGTMAWLTSEETIVNKFSTKSWDLEVDLEEDFTEDKAQDLLPGAVIKKEGWVENIKDLPVLVRVHIEEVWGTKRGTDGKILKDDNLTQSAITENVAMLDTALTEDYLPEGTDYTSDKWVKIGNYFYYTEVLAPKTDTTDVDQTTNVISDVTINPNLTVEQHKQFGGKFFDINLNAQAVQIENDAYLSAWGISNETTENQDAIKALVKNAINEYQTPEVPTTPDAAE